MLFLGRLEDSAEMSAGIPNGLPIITLPGVPAPAGHEGVRAWDQLIATTSPCNQQTERHANELATLVYTSGSTGTPKGVMIPFTAIGTAGKHFLGTVATISSQDRMLSYLPLAHVFERAVTMTGALQYGYQLFFNDSLATFSADIRRARPTLFHSVPRLWVKFQLGVLHKYSQEKLAALLADPHTAEATRKEVLAQLGLDEVRIAITGSAPLPPTVLRWYRDLGLELLEGYGMSENFSYSHISQPGNCQVGSVGQVQLGVQHRIAENGEIQLKTPTGMQGYYKEPAKTREAFTDDGWFRTGDRGEIDEQGRLSITGRLKELFKTGKGKYVAPVPIENRLINHPKVEAVCVTGSGRPQPVGLIMLDAQAQRGMGEQASREELESELQALMSHVNATLDPHERLDFLVVVHEQWTVANGLLTPTMKIKRHAIEKRYEPLIEQWSKENRQVVWENASPERQTA
ncbi:Long-chain-fatty-acid--CoA ligase FadD15 [compost metagenome]